MAELAPGSHFAGHEIEAVIGQGGMGVVYRALHISLRRTVALKVVRPELAQDSDYRRRFERESQSAASLDHPNVVEVYHAGEHEGQLYITMRYVEGTDLGAMIEAKGRLEPRFAAYVVAEVAGALDEAHKHGLVHRDVKPANVLIREREGAAPRIYLTDFGVAKQLTSDSLTGTGLFVGTVDYAAPEQVLSNKIDARADVYALGGVLFHALTGSVPFPRATAAAKLLAHTSDPPPSPLEFAPDIPAELNEVVQRAMAKEPKARYPSAGDLGRAAAAATEGRAVAVPEATVAVGEAAPITDPPAGAPGLQDTDVAHETPKPTPTPTPPIPPMTEPEPPVAVPPPRFEQQPARSQAGGFFTRNRLRVGLTAASFLIAGVIAAAVLGGGGGDGSSTDEDPTTEEEPVTTDEEPVTTEEDPVTTDEVTTPNFEGGLTFGEQALAKSIQPYARSSCSGIEPAERGSIAAIECSVSGASYMVLESFLELKDMNHAYARWTGDLPTDQGFCGPNWDVSDQWNSGAAIRGRLSCRDTPDGGLELVWTDDARINTGWIQRTDRRRQFLQDVWAGVVN